MADWLHNHLEERKLDGRIEESDSCFASPIILVPKPNGDLSMVCDCYGLNSICEPIDMFPLPRVDDLIDRVGQAKYLTKLDATKGYLAVPLDDESVPYSAFITAQGLFQWRYIPFSLKSAQQHIAVYDVKIVAPLSRFCSCLFT